MKYFVTGAAGFIGSNLVDRLLQLGHDVTGYDNFSTGKRQFLDSALGHSQFTLITGDLLDFDLLKKSLVGHDFIFHLAANADVRFGLQHPRKDLEQNTIVTFNVLEAMRQNGITHLAFSSTGSVYGEAAVFPTPETAPFPIQTSLYGASKLACEGLIAAYAEGFQMKTYIFRFVSILGERYTHGHIFDFYKKLLKDPTQLEILGNGNQKKSYLYIQDCLDAMLVAIQGTHEKVNLFNLGTSDYCQVNDSISWITQALNINPQLNHTGGERGWIGDNPFIFLDTSKIRSLGWAPKLSIQEGVLKTLHYLRDNSSLLVAEED